ncbi:MAG TPA: type II toxin-antitoxin system RelB/DinJ family antitoxin [Candidatus Andersenbacteria bacterium]|nr:type II toxin-antitoxin system RelB/DinJ family antitoxin [Candidatus Andersenbacteria bacterium]
MTTIQIRIDEKTKKSAQKLFHSLGMDMSTAIKAFLKQATRKQGIPFPLYTENGLTVEEEREILQSAEEAERGENVIGPFTTIEDALEELHKQ